VANADNEAIASSGEDYVQALADKMRAAGTFLPTLTLAPSYTLTHRTGSGDGGSFIIPGVGTGQDLDGDGTIDTGGGTAINFGSTGSGTSDRLTVPLNASVSGSLADVSNLRASRRTAEQRAQLLLNQRETVLLQVAQAYYDVLRFERQTAVFESSVRLRSEQVRDQEARQRLGGVRPLDVAQSQAQLASTRVSLTQARTDAANARSALARLMGVAAVRGRLTDAFNPPAIEEAALDAWQTEALAQRHDLLAALRAVESARLGVQAAIRQYFPSVSINFNYYLYNDPKSSQNWAGGISASLPIFSALQIEADIRRAWSVYRQSGLALSSAQRQVIDDVTQAYQNLAGNRAKIADLQIQVTAAQRAVDLTERGYELGSETNLDRLVQQDNLLSAELNLVSEQFAEKSNYLALLRAAGRLASVLP
jgi:outer membrane protein